MRRKKCLESLKRFWGPMLLVVLIEAMQFDWVDFAVLSAL